MLLSGRMALGKPRRRWKENIRKYLWDVSCGGGNWMEQAQGRVPWRAVVMMVIEFSGSLITNGMQHFSRWFIFL